MIGEDCLKSVTARIVANYEPEHVLLFGSQASNVATVTSDVDLLIIKNTTVPRWRRGKNIEALFANSPIKLDLLFYTMDEVDAERAQPDSFINAILRSARLIYSRPNSGGRISAE
jgi:predicted nucleotidyltransferase